MYTGATNDVNRRIHEHNNTRKASKYTRSRRPVTLVWSSIFMPRSNAYRLERHIKSLDKKKKEEIVANNTDVFNDFDFS